MSSLDRDDLVRLFQENIIDSHRKSWVVFSHGSCVILPDASVGEDLSALAIETMRSYGPVIPGGPGGDFNPISVKNGFIVTSHCPTLVTGVLTSEVGEMGRFPAGLLGRGRRADDADSLEIIHIQDNRSSTNA